MGRWGYPPGRRILPTRGMPIQTPTAIRAVSSPTRLETRRPHMPPTRQTPQSVMMVPRLLPRTALPGPRPGDTGARPADRRRAPVPRPPQSPAMERCRRPTFPRRHSTHRREACPSCACSSSSSADGRSPSAARRSSTGRASPRAAARRPSRAAAVSAGCGSGTRTRRRPRHVGAPRGWPSCAGAPATRPRPCRSCTGRSASAPAGRTTSRRWPLCAPCCTARGRRLDAQRRRRRRRERHHRHHRHHRERRRRQLDRRR